MNGLQPQEFLDRLFLRFVHASCYRDGMPLRYLNLGDLVVKHAQTRFQKLGGYFDKLKAPQNPKKGGPEPEGKDWQFQEK